MSQSPIALPTTGTVSGLQLVQDANAALDTLNTKWAGSSAPSGPEPYQDWLDTSTTPPTLRIYDGAQWVAVAQIDATNHQVILLGNAVSGPASATANHIPKFADTSGKVLADGYAVGTAANNVVQLDANAKLPAVDGSQLTNMSVTFRVPTIFTASGTFTTPIDTLLTDVFKFTVTGGGGTGASGGGTTNSSGGAGAGGTFIAWVTDCSPSQNIGITVGGTGAVSAIDANGIVLTAPPGGNGSSASPGIGGIPSNSNSSGITVLNISGGDGVNANGNVGGGVGGSSYWGGAGTSGYGSNGQPGRAWGSGGGGGDGAGGAGAPGIVIVERVK